MPVLEALGTALPGPPIAQSDIRAKAEEILSVLAPELVEKMAVFETVGIRTRHFVRPLDWFLEPHGWGDRGAIFAEEGLALVEAAATDALRAADLGPEAVD